MPTIKDRAAEAGDPATGAGRLEALAGDRAPSVRAAVASNPSTPVAILEVLVRDPRPHVRWGVAENPLPEALRLALSSEDHDVRAMASDHPALDRTTFERLLADPHVWPRERLAYTAPDWVVTALARDESPRVRAAAAVGRNLPVDELVRLAGDRRAEVRWAAVGSGRLPAETLLSLAGDRSADVRWMVLTRHPERLDIAAALKDDPVDWVAQQARGQIERPRGPVPTDVDEDLARFLAEITHLESGGGPGGDPMP